MWLLSERDAREVMLEKGLERLERSITLLSFYYKANGESIPR